MSDARWSDPRENDVRDGYPYKTLVCRSFIEDTFADSRTIAIAG